MKVRKIVTRLRLSIERKTNFRFPFNLESSIQKSLSELEVDIQIKTKNLLCAYGVTAAKAQKLAVMVPASQIIANIQYVLNQKNIKNVPPYLVTAIEKNYTLKDAPSLNTNTRDIAGEFANYCVERVKAKFESMPHDEQSDFRKNFLDYIQNNVKERLTKTKFDNEGGWQSRWVQTTFDNWLKPLLLKELHETNIDHYATHRPRIQLEKMLLEVQDSSIAIKK